jgi:hypothetical protein
MLLGRVALASLGFELGVTVEMGVVWLRRAAHQAAAHTLRCAAARWRKRTPAMAAGLTDHVWTLRELLTAKFEPLDSQSISR